MQDDGTWVCQDEWWISQGRALPACLLLLLRLLLLLLLLPLPLPLLKIDCRQW